MSAKEMPFKRPVRSHLADETLVIDADGKAIASTLTAEDDYHNDYEAINTRTAGIIAAINAYSPERDAEAKLTKARLSARTKTVIALREKLSVIVPYLKDEGDRVYFDSTNDADHLRDLYDELEQWEWAAIASDVIADDPYEASRKAHAELQQLREKNEKQAAAVQVLVDALRDIAAFSDTGASEILESTGSWAAFDEPGAAEKARAALASYEASK